MKSLKKSTMIAFIIVIIGGLFISGSSIAYFTSVDQNTGNSFKSGTLRVELDKSDGDIYFSLDNIAPGDSGEKQIVISNTGSLDLQYQVELSLSGELSTGAYPLELTLFDRNDQPIDMNRKRIVLTGESETLSLAWEMPEEADNTYQNATGTLSIRVNAEQVSSQNGSELARNINEIVQDMEQNELLVNASLVYAKSGGSSNSWSVKIESYLEGGSPGTNIYGFENPVSAPDPQYQGQAVINYDTMQLSEQFWNPAIFITGNSAYSYNNISDHTHYSRLYGSLIFYKSDDTSDMVYFYSIDDNGVKSALNSFTLP